jgi:NADH:ubiquinone oxidoreductase subunit F (NADH-binding)
VGFDELTKAGSMMGSGGMIVMDEDTCMVDVARYFIDFLTDESCGKCVPCREGLRQMHQDPHPDHRGQGQGGRHQTLEDLPKPPRRPPSAPGQKRSQPVLSTLRYFRDEYEAHINEKKCPALSCKELIAYHIDPEKCKACMICAKMPGGRH